MATDEELRELPLGAVRPLPRLGGYFVRGRPPDHADWISMGEAAGLLGYQTAHPIKQMVRAGELTTRQARRNGLRWVLRSEVLALRERTGLDD